MKKRDYLNETINWKQAEEPEFPYTTTHDGRSMRIRLNNFPAEHLYTLLVGSSEISFDDWPSQWGRPSKSVKVKKVASSTAAKYAAKAAPAKASSAERVRSASARVGKAQSKNCRPR